MLSKLCRHKSEPALRFITRIADFSGDWRARHLDHPTAEHHKTTVHCTPAATRSLFGACIVYSCRGGVRSNLPGLCSPSHPLTQLLPPLEQQGASRGMQDRVGTRRSPQCWSPARGGRWNPPARPSRPLPGHHPPGTWECATAGTWGLDKGSWGGPPPLPPPGRPPAAAVCARCMSSQHCLCCRHHAGLCFHWRQDRRLRLHGRRPRGAAPACRRPPRRPHADRVRAQEGCRFHQGGCWLPPSMQQWAQRGAATACVPLRGDTEPSMAAAWPSCLRPPPGCLC
jgi:hypothetical protein